MHDNICKIAWVPIAERRPARVDADEGGCVLLWDVNNGLMYKNIFEPYNYQRAPVTHWATPPGKPLGATDPAPDLPLIRPRGLEAEIAKEEREKSKAAGREDRA